MFGGIKQWLWAHAKMLIGIFLSTVAIRFGGIFGKILGTMGLSYVAFNYVLPDLKSFLMSYANQLPENVLNLITYTRFDVMMCMILSACVVRVTSNLFIGQGGNS